MAAKTTTCRCPAPKRSARSAAEYRKTVKTMQAQALIRQRQDLLTEAEEGPCPQCGADSLLAKPGHGPLHEIRCPACGYFGVAVPTPAQRRSRRDDGYASEEHRNYTEAIMLKRDEEAKKKTSGRCPMCHWPMPHGPEFGGPIAHSVKCHHCGWEGVQIG